MKRIPRVAAIHDLSGLGRCSLTVILPVLSVLGTQCCPLTTAVLSAHMGFPMEEGSFCDLTPQLAQSMRHWEVLDTSVDAVYSGFLGSAHQMDITANFMRKSKEKGAFLLVDPVMADHGKVYHSYTEDMCKKMIDLAQMADLITPNLTEAAILLGEDYQAVPTTGAGIARWVERLSADGRRSVILTGVSGGDGLVGAACYDSQTGQADLVLTQAEPGQFPGTGDLFASVVLGEVLRGSSLISATRKAVDFVRTCVAHTLELETATRDGVEFEPLLGSLIQTK